MTNLIEPIENCLIQKIITNNKPNSDGYGGLSSYEQPKCKCTITDDHTYRIYRDPNNVYSDSNRTMWGGLIFKNYDNWIGLVESHRYVIYFELKGKTTNPVSDVYWSNKAEWDGTSNGLGASAINVSHSSIGADWQSDKWVEYRYEWTCSAIYKTCTKSYGTFVEGTSYNTYRDFKFGFDYRDTGSLGTDLYLRNFRLYDITNRASSGVNLSKNGVLTSSTFLETSAASDAQMNIGNEFLTPAEVVEN